MDYSARQDRLLQLAADEAGVGCLLVTAAANITWLTGFAGEVGAVLLLPERAVFATDRRYQAAARALAADMEVIIDRAPVPGLVALAEESGELTLGFEDAHVTVGQLKDFNAMVGESMPMVAVHPIAERLRAVKDPEEVRLLRRACEISTQALASILGEIAVGMSEVHVARLLEARMGDMGADDRAFATIVATGSNSASPHHHSSGRTIRSGDILEIDFGAQYEGYNADCTRMFVVGSEPAPWQVELHAIVERAAAAGRAALAVGVEAIEVDGAARSVVAEAGRADNFDHGTGHGVGLEVHEAPRLAQGSEGMVEAGHVVTVEPGVYLPGRGGARIEDVCVVDHDGIEVLTQAPRELLRLG